jgi:hypothetical protein
MLDGLRENVLCLFKIAAGVQHAVDFRPVLSPLLDLVEVAIVREERVVGSSTGQLFGGRSVGNFIRRSTPADVVSPVRLSAARPHGRKK